MATMMKHYYEQDSCYDPNSFGFDQFQPMQYTINHPIFNAQNELLNSQNKIMEQMTSICDMVGQYMQKKEEDKRIAEDQAAKDQYWNIPICYNDDEDEYSLATQEYLKKFSSAITPDLPKSDSLIMEDDHLDTIPETESNELIKSSVEDLVHTPSESDGISKGECDLPVYDDFSSKKDEGLILIKISEKGVDTDILHEKLLNVNLLIANIEALKDNPIPSSNFVIKSPSTFPNSFLEETNTFDNSLTESETFLFNMEEISSGSTTTRSDYSLPDYEPFYLNDGHIEEKSSGRYPDFEDSRAHGNGYQERDKPKAKPDETEHEIGKSAKFQISIECSSSINDDCSSSSTNNDCSTSTTSAKSMMDLNDLVKKEVRDRFSGAVETFTRWNLSSSGLHTNHPRHRSSEHVTSSKDVHADTDRGRISRNGNTSKRAVMSSSSRPTSSGEPIDSRSKRLGSCSGRISTTQRLHSQHGFESKSSSFAHPISSKSGRDDPLQSFELLTISIRKRK
ncbi:hypothetical protein Tco_0216865 [Tanacetum coccineum]